MLLLVKSFLPFFLCACHGFTPVLRLDFFFLRRGHLLLWNERLLIWSRNERHALVLHHSTELWLWLTRWHRHRHWHASLHLSWYRRHTELGRKALWKLILSRLWLFWHKCRVFRHGHCHAFWQRHLHLLLWLFLLLVAYLFRFLLVLLGFLLLFRRSSIDLVSFLFSLCLNRFVRSRLGLHLIPVVNLSRLLSFFFFIFL